MDVVHSQLSQIDRLQRFVDGRLNAFEHIVNGAEFRRALGTLTIWRCAGVEDEIVIHDVDDVEEADVFRWRRQHIAAALALEGLQIAGVLEPWHDLQEVIVGNVHLLCDHFSGTAAVRREERIRIVVICQIHHDANGVVCGDVK